MLSTRPLTASDTKVCWLCRQSIVLDHHTTDERGLSVSIPAATKSKCCCRRRRAKLSCGDETSLRAKRPRSLLGHLSAFNERHASALMGGEWHG